MYRETLGVHTCELAVSSCNLTVSHWFADSYSMSGDKRQRKSWLMGAYPSFGFLEPFSEKGKTQSFRCYPCTFRVHEDHLPIDELWRPDVRESDAEQDRRSRMALDEVTRHDPTAAGRGRSGEG